MSDRDIRILLCDDHPIVRGGLRALLDATDGLCVVGEAGDGAAAVDAARELTPDVVLMDLQMPGVDGVTAIGLLQELADVPRVLVLTTYDTDADILRAVEAGATGYLLKDAPQDDLVRAIRATAAGEPALAPAVAGRLMERMSGRNRGPGDTNLTPRELEILDQLAAGRTNKEIAKALFVSEATVKTHLVHLYDKLGVDGRTAAVRAGVERGLIRFRPDA